MEVFLNTMQEMLCSKMLCGKMPCGRSGERYVLQKRSANYFQQLRKTFKKMEQKSRLPGKAGQAAFLVRRNSIQWMSSFKPQLK